MQRGEVSLRVRWVLLFYGLLAALAVIWRLWADEMLPWRLTHTAPGAPAWARLGIGIAAGSGLVVVSRAWVARSRAGQRLASELGRLLGLLSWRRAWLFALASGLAEEALFRGALQPQVGLVAATLLFGAAHYVPRPGLRVWSLFALLAGALFGAMFEATGDLLAPATAHVVVNGLNLHWLARSARAGTGLNDSNE
ncbi:MAG: CPBP family glutamic-type intramembrane protease [Myxococcota bacterium]